MALAASELQRTRRAPRASVVVPVRNAGSLDHLVTAFERQSVGPDAMEILIADDGSDDDAPALAAASAPDLQIQVLPGEPRNSYAARNRGVSHAGADAVAFCDADCAPEPSWIEEGLAALEEYDLAAGAIRLTAPERRTLWNLLDIDTFLDQERAVRASAAATANLFVRRSVFEQMGAFDDSLPNQGDHDFVGRAVANGFRLGYASRAVVVHPTRDRSAFLRKLWVVNHRYASRCGRDGIRPEALKLRSLVPLVQPIRARRRFGRSITLDRRRMAECGINPTRRERLLALPLQYLVVPYVSAAAQFAGRRRGRRP